MGCAEGGEACDRKGWPGGGSAAASLETSWASGQPDGQAGTRARGQGQARGYTIRGMLSAHPVKA